MPHPLRFLFGYVRISLPKDKAAEAVQIMALTGRIYRHFIFSGDEAFFDTPFFTFFPNNSCQGAYRCFGNMLF